MLRPPAVEVVVSGPASVMARLKPADVRPFVEVASLVPGSRAPVAVELVAGLVGVSVVETVPAEVQLRAKK
jgi:hypothetical protein